MKQFLRIPSITAGLIVLGVYRWGMIKQPIPKSLFLFCDAMLKFVISFFFAKERVYLDLDICFVSILFNLNRFLFLKSSEHLNILLLAVLAPMKLIFVIIFSRIIYKKHLNPVQYISICIIILGNCLIQLQEKNKKSTNEIIYILYSIIGNLFGAIAMIFFDKRIRKKNKGFWNYLYTFSFLSLIVACIKIPLEMKLSDYEFLIHLKNYRFFLNISSSVGETFLNTLLVFSISPLKKGLLGNLIIVSDSFLSNLFYEEKMSKISALACFITYSGILIFEYETHKKKTKNNKIRD